MISIFCPFLIKQFFLFMIFIKIPSKTHRSGEILVKVVHFCSLSLPKNVQNVPFNGLKINTAGKVRAHAGWFVICSRGRLVGSQIWKSRRKSPSKRKNLLPPQAENFEVYGAFLCEKHVQNALRNVLFVQECHQKIKNPPAAGMLLCANIHSWNYQSYIHDNSEVCLVRSSLFSEMFTYLLKPSLLE